MGFLLETLPQRALGLDKLGWYPKDIPSLPVPSASGREEKLVKNTTCRGFLTDKECSLGHEA
jgi:hypothetical protein